MKKETKKKKTIEKSIKCNPKREGAEGVEGCHLIISDNIVGRNILTSYITSSDLI